MKKNICKIIASLLCAALLLPCFACGGDSQSTQSSEQPLETVANEYVYHGGVSEYSILVRDDANYYESFAAS